MRILTCTHPDLNDMFFLAASLLDVVLSCSLAGHVHR